MEPRSEALSPENSPELSPANSPYLHPSPTFSDTKLPHLTPLSSRDDDYAISSDSDIASFSSSEFSLRSPSRRNRLESDSSARSFSQSPKTPKNKRDPSQQGSRSRSRGKRRLSRNKDDLPPAANSFKNLLILEESLRQQVSSQKSLRHKYLLFLSILSSLLALSLYHLFFKPDPPNGYVRVMHQFISFIIMVTLFLYYISGEYHRTIVLPRRFLSSANKGLRQLNVRLTKVKTPLSERLIDVIRYSLHLVAGLSQMLLNWAGPFLKLSLGMKIQQLISEMENRAQPRVGATEVKLVLNPRIFSTNIRENWEMYRNEFWAREGARRRGAKMGIPEENDRRELIDKDKKERKERRKSKLSSL